MFQIRLINEAIKLGILDLKAFSADLGIVTKRDLEKQGTRFLLKKMLNNTEVVLCYTPENKPFLSERAEHLSISHSHDKLAIIINNKESTGVDIELIRDKVKTVRHKFLNENELLFAQNDTEKLITLWAAKEALYKVYGKKELDFRTNIFVFDFSDENLSGKIKTDYVEKKYNLASESIDNYKLVYIINEV